MKKSTKNVNNQPPKPNLISKLPEEVLEKIFSFLGGNYVKSDLVNATLVCKAWNRIISESPRLMDMIEINFNIDDEFDFFCVYDFKILRQYRHVIMKHDYYSLERYGEEEDAKFWGIEKVIVSLKNLTTFELRQSPVFPCHIEDLSGEHLHTLIFYSCRWYYKKFPELLEDRGEIEVCEMKSLRVLRFIEDNAGTTFVLKYIKCTKLDVLQINTNGVDEVVDAGEIIPFMNQLDRCDEIDIKISNWNFEDSVQLRPKFLWRKLKLFCKQDERIMSQNAISSIEVLCKASATNAESEIELKSFKPECAHLWTIILGNCKGIKVLLLSNSTPPSGLGKLPYLSQLQKLALDTKTLKAESFSNFVKNLSTATQLEIHSSCRKFELSTESELLLQPFFNQIIDLKLSLSSSYGPIPSETLNLKFTNLSKLTVYEKGSEHSIQSLQLFKTFCAQNQNLQCLTVETSYRQYVAKDYLLKWYKELDGKSTIKSCNVKTQYGHNWRHVQRDEKKFFGRALTKKESRFFV